MNKYLVIGVGITGLLLSACETIRGRVTQQENLLAAAGFDVKPANTRGRQTELSELPADRFVARAKGDHLVYLYADPVVCDCLYVGDQNAFNAYKREVFQQHIADQQQLTAEMYNQPWGWGVWSWGPWGLGPRFWWW
jgi:hypothetical protein